MPDVDIWEESLMPHSTLPHEFSPVHFQFIETITAVLEARDPYTAGHSQRVAEYSHAIAIEMGLTMAQANEILIAAKLHDVGKIGVPDSVLRKAGPLTAEEFALVKRHPQIGRRMLEKVAGFEPLLAVVELHHENVDGSGYPYGLRGDQIPVDARIVHVADAFDAMTSDRAYRESLTVARSVLEIERNSGRMFEPMAAEAFLSLFRYGDFDGILARPRTPFWFPAEAAVSAFARAVGGRPESAGFSPAGQTR
jgi:HD-GYP domain-containing protein (c-di-GMP phosphodiesterase class II)